eukprot:COSAG01_NODE_3992_length_5457_cov_5.077081_4_plen_803_part_00
MVPCTDVRSPRSLTCRCVAWGLAAAGRGGGAAPKRPREKRVLSLPWITRRGVRRHVSREAFLALMASSDDGKWEHGTDDGANGGAAVKAATDNQKDIKERRHAEHLIKLPFFNEHIPGGKARAEIAELRWKHIKRAYTLLNASQEKLIEEWGKEAAPRCSLVDFVTRVRQSQSGLQEFRKWKRRVGATGVFILLGLGEEDALLCDKTREVQKRLRKMFGDHALPKCRREENENGQIVLKVLAPDITNDAKRQQKENTVTMDVATAGIKLVHDWYAQPSPPPGPPPPPHPTSPQPPPTSPQPPPLPPNGPCSVPQCQSTIVFNSGWNVPHDRPIPLGDTAIAVSPRGNKRSLSNGQQRASDSNPHPNHKASKVEGSRGDEQHDSLQDLLKKCVCLGEGHKARVVIQGADWDSIHERLKNLHRRRELWVYISPTSGDQANLEMDSSWNVEFDQGLCSRFEGVRECASTDAYQYFCVWPGKHTSWPPETKELVWFPAAGQLVATEIMLMSLHSLQALVNQLQCHYEDQSVLDFVHVVGHNLFNEFRAGDVKEQLFVQLMRVQRTNFTLVLHTCHSAGVARAATVEGVISAVGCEGTEQHTLFQNMFKHIQKTLGAGREIKEAIDKDKHFKYYESELPLRTIEWGDLFSSDKCNINCPNKHGGQANLFFGEWRHMKIAIKVFHNSDSQVGFAAFKAESRILQNLNHERIVRFYGVSACKVESPSIYAIVMEKMDGNLRELCDGVDKRVFVQDHETHLTIGIGIASGLNFLHENNVCHRDLKPENVPTVLRMMCAELWLTVGSQRRV